MGRWSFGLGGIPNVPRLEPVTCIVCRTSVLVDKTLPKGMVLNPNAVFVCPVCVVKTNPLIYKQHEAKEKLKLEEKLERQHKAAKHGD